MNVETIVFSVATISVVSGIHIGIRRLSEICFGLGTEGGCAILFTYSRLLCGGQVL